MNSFITSRLIVFIGIFIIVSTFACEDDEKIEASEAFKNCASSSQDTIYRRIREEKDEDRPSTFCTILDSLYSGCKLQKLALQKCQGISDTEALIQTWLFGMRYTLDLTYRHQNIDVQSCEIFKKPEATKPELTSSTSSLPNVKVNHKTNQLTEDRNKQKLSQDFSHDNSVAYEIVPNSLLLYLLILLTLRA